MGEIDLKNKRILIVEDSPTQALLLKDSLEKNQFVTRIAKDGLEGIQKLKEEIPDLIISDVEMPNMNGYEFCKKIKAEQKYKDIPVIILTNLLDPLDVIKGMDCGADSFLTKPCEVNLLLTTIQNSLQNIHLKNEFPKEKLSFYFGNKLHSIEINIVQITELLLSTYSNAIQKNLELDKALNNLNRLNKDLEEKNEKLKNLNEQKNQWLGMAAHDLKNPLAVIQGYSSFILSTSKGEIDDEKARLMIQRISDSTSYMINVIDDLLDFSSIEAGTITLHSAEIDLLELIQKDLLFFESLACKKNIKVLFNYKIPIPKVYCDPNKIDQVLNNLIGNGIKFSHPNETLEISLTPSPNEITICVKDKGVGMSDEVKETLFQPFAKTHAKGTAGEKGFGLGLAIVHKIVLAHKGKIWVESKLGSGTSLYVTLPYNNQSSTEIQKARA